MKKLVIKIIILFVLLLVVAVGIILLPLPKNSYTQAIIDKHRILADMQIPKIVLAGGSNLAFGIDSAAIQEQLRIPVVNTAVHGGFGLGRMLDDISPFLNTGDIVIIASECTSFVDIWSGEDAAFNLIFDAGQYRLLFSSYCSWPKKIGIYLSNKLAGFFSAFMRRNSPPDPRMYTRDGFNKYGDYVKHLGMENIPFDTLRISGALNQKYINRFFQIIDEFTKRGITVLITYPSYEEESFHNVAELIHNLDEIFRGNENMRVISTPTDYCFPKKYMYDTALHLNAEGRTIRTRRLIHDLQASGVIK